MRDLEDKTVSLIELASRQEHRSGLVEVLRCIGESLRCQACLMWELFPTSETEKGSGAALHVAAHWVKYDPAYPFHELPFESVTGTAIRTKIPLAVAVSDPRVHRDWLTSHPQLRWMCSIPLLDEDKVVGALNVYREDE